MIPQQTLPTRLWTGLNSQESQFFASPDQVKNDVDDQTATLKQPDSELPDTLGVAGKTQSDNFTSARCPNPRQVLGHGRGRTRRRLVGVRGRSRCPASGGGFAILCPEGGFGR